MNIFAILSGLTPLQWALYALIPLLVIVVHLLVTRHASIGPNHYDRWVNGLVACGDVREQRDMTLFGGVAGLTFGWHYAFVALLLPVGWPKNLLWGYAIMNASLSVIQFLWLVVQLLRRQGGDTAVIRIKSHLNGCGWSTAQSPLWILYWIQKVPSFGWVVGARDLITWVDFLAGVVPAFMLGNLASIIEGKAASVEIGPVSHPHGH